MRRALSIAVPALLALVSSSALGTDAPPRRKVLTLERVHAAEPLVEPGPTGLRWRDATRFTYLKRDGSGPKAPASLWEEDVVTGKVTKILEAIPVEGTGKDGKPRTFPIAGAQWNEAATALLVTAENDIWLFALGEKAARRLTNDEAEEELPLFSPDGTRVAFVKGNDLWFVETATGNATRLTTDGSPAVLNGRLDWVYEEELAGRNGGRAFEWAPDSSALAFLRLDQSRVPEYPLVDFLPANGKLMPQHYPKPGDPNSTPSVRVVSWGPGGSGLATNAVGFDGDTLLVGPAFSWTPDSSAVAFAKMNRTQTELELSLLPRSGSAVPRSLLKETSASWVNSHEPPLFLPDGSGFLWLSERSGFLHLWRYRMDGTLVGPVTTGEWAIEGDPKLDAGSGTVFFTSTAKDPSS